MRFVSDEPGMAGEQQGDLVSRLRAVIEAKDEQIAALTAGLEASRERERRLEFRRVAPAWSQQARDERTARWNSP